jgi:phosphinothricin acetyltransferase
MSRSDHLVVRDALPIDAEAICAVYNAAIAERGSTFETELRSPEDFNERIGAERFPLLVAKAGSAAIGWAGLASYSDRPCYAGIGEASVYVAPEARGKRVGTALVEALASQAERRAFHKLLGKLFTDNIASVRLCERCGFLSVGVHRRHGQLDGEWRDVLVVERLLAPAPLAEPQAVGTFKGTTGALTPSNSPVRGRRGRSAAGNGRRDRP